MTFLSKRTSANDTIGPEIDEGVDVLLERVGGGELEDLVDEDVGLELSEKEERERPRIDAADSAGFDGAAEVLAEDADGATGRDLFVVPVKGNDERRGVHLHGDGRADHRVEERDHASCEVAQDRPGIGLGVEVGQGGDELRHDDGARAHGRAEEELFGCEVPQDGSGRDAESAGDVSERGRRKPPCGEGRARGVEDLIAADPRRPAHL
ncbi:MAG: hypothetical protein ABI779_20540 [Acidobacteriota bacterium]